MAHGDVEIRRRELTELHEDAGLRESLSLPDTRIPDLRARLDEESGMTGREGDDRRARAVRDSLRRLTDGYGNYVPYVIGVQLVQRRSADGGGSPSF